MHSLFTGLISLLLVHPAFALDEVTFWINWLAHPEAGGYYQALVDGVAFADQNTSSQHQSARADQLMKSDFLSASVSPDAFRFFLLSQRRHWRCAQPAPHLQFRPALC
jgi:hypothetical protein